MRALQHSRLAGRLLSRAMIVAGFALAFASSSFGQQAIVGNWRQPINCQSPGNPNGWPDGSMHLIHVVARDPATGLLTGRCLTYYAPSCQGVTHVDMPSGCLGAPPFFPCGELAEPFPARLYNPADNSNAYLNDPGVSIYPCVGHVQCANSAVIFTGGGCDPAHATLSSILFWPTSPTSGEWRQLAPLTEKRWYPSTVTLSDGRTASLGGVRNVVEDNFGCNEDLDGEGYVYAKVPETYDPAANQTYQMPLSTTKCVLTYPFTYILPKTQGFTHERIFWAGPTLQSSVLHIPNLDPSTWSSAPPYWTDLPSLTDLGLYADDGSSVMYEPGKILKCGGYSPDITSQCDTSDRTAVIDFNTASPAWVSTTGPGTNDMDMITDRKHHNTIVTPLGRIVAIGGQHICSDICHSSVFVCGCTTAVLATEWFDPNSVPPRWFPLATMSIPRAYHSTATLLADGTILSCGGEDWFQGQPGSRSSQIFEPPYLFDQLSTAQPTPYAQRPVILHAPEHMDYNAAFNITMSAADVQNAGMVSLVRLAAVTHGFDQNQRFVKLMIAGQSGTTLQVTGPADGSYAPPGYYMLFVVSQPPGSGLLGTPSIARYVRVGCVSDLIEDCVTDGLDLALLLGQWGPCPAGGGCAADFNGDGTVDGLDLAILLGKWDVQCAYCPPPPTGGGSSPMSGGGESATAGGPTAPGSPGSGDCGGGIDLFQQWLDSGDMDAFWQWLDCTTGLGGGTMQ